MIFRAENRALKAGIFWGYKKISFLNFFTRKSIYIFLKATFILIIQSGLRWKFFGKSPIELWAFKASYQKTCLRFLVYTLYTHKKGIFVLQGNNFRLISQFSANEHTTEVCKNVIRVFFEFFFDHKIILKNLRLVFSIHMWSYNRKSGQLGL